MYIPCFTQYDVTLLHEVASMGKTSMVQLLLEYGADIESCNMVRTHLYVIQIVLLK